MPLYIPDGHLEFIIGVESPSLRRCSFSFGCSVDTSVSTTVANVEGWLLGSSPTQFQGVLNSDWVIVGLTARNVGLSTDRSYHAPGAGDGAPLPPNVSAKVRKLTGLSGRAHRGSMFWPGVLLDAAVDADGSIHSGDIAVLQALADSLHTQLTLGGADAELFHEVTVAHPTPAPDIVSSFNALGRIHTQRRRLPR
jgi:hypothetical protein